MLANPFFSQRKSPQGAQDVVGECTPESLTSKLNYVWPNPSSPVPPDSEPFWLRPSKDPKEEFVESLAEDGWRVDHIRQQINRLNLSPKGRTRADLLRQLIEGFLDPERVNRQLRRLNDEEQRFYTYLLLYQDLMDWYTVPTPIEQMEPFSGSPATFLRRIIDIGLGLFDENGEFFIPSSLLSVLPPRYLPFPTEPEPTTYVKAADPQLLLSQIQQLLSLVQSESYSLRPRPRWLVPATMYSRDYQVWPPVPADVQRLLNTPNFQGNITLCPPLPYLSDAALVAWSAKLELPRVNVEFLYHILSSAYLLFAGSPVTVNNALIPAWLMCSPGSQAVLLFRLYCIEANWAEWWPAWRSGQVKVEWGHRVYWDLGGIDRVMATTYSMLRRVILAVLSFLPHDTWLAVDKVVDFLVKLYPRPETHHYQDSLLLTDARGHWKGFLEQVLRAMLQGPLYLLGFVEAAPDLDNMEVFRLRYLQDVYWERIEALPIAEAPTLRRDDVTFDAGEQTLRVKPPARAQFLAAVQQWARSKGWVNNRLLYQLDVHLLHSAFERGATPETLKAVWEESADFPPLPEIQQWWRYWWERYGHVRFYPQQALLLTRDEFTLHELQAALPTMREAILGLVTPRVALLRPEHVSRILSDMERQGYMPKEEV